MEINLNSANPLPPMKITPLPKFIPLASILISSTLHSEQPVSDDSLLAAYDGLRVADVCDGLDMIGLRDQTIMNQRIEALWKDVDTRAHLFQGIAVTAKYVPTNKVVPNPMPKEDFQKWEGSWYNEFSSEPFVEFLKEGSVVVLDVEGDGDTGSVGSYNGLAWYSKGARGIVSNGGIRDTDELILQKVPVYLDVANRGRGIRPGRNEIQSVQKPIVVGDVLVNPGDVIVADGDGVVVVPRKLALQVADYAREIMNKDKGARRSLYKQLNMPMDKTVKD